MDNLSAVGRKLYGIAIAGIGFLTICYADFPYMLIPPNHSWIPGLTVASYIMGALFVLAGACIVLEKRTRVIALLLAGVFLLIFCFYFIPYQLISSPNNTQLGDWENAEKELALSAGALVVASCFPAKNENVLIKLLAMLIPFGAIIFGLIITSFGIDHFLYAKAAADYVPSWIPKHLFWIYFAGIALMGAGIAILLKVKVRLIATLLGMMIFTWFIILHIPYVIASRFADGGGEATSALIALAYSGISFVIAGTAKKVPTSTDL